MRISPFLLASLTAVAIAACTNRDPVSQPPPPVQPPGEEEPTIIEDTVGSHGRIVPSALLVGQTSRYVRWVGRASGLRDGVPFQTFMGDTAIITVTGVEGGTALLEERLSEGSASLGDPRAPTDASVARYRMSLRGDTLSVEIVTAPWYQDWLDSPLLTWMPIALAPVDTSSITMFGWWPDPDRSAFYPARLARHEQHGRQYFDLVVSMTDRSENDGPICYVLASRRAGVVRSLLYGMRSRRGSGWDLL